MTVYKYRDRTKDSQRRSANNKQRALEYLGGKCVRCGTSKYLEFDHIDPSTKEFSLGTKWQTSFENKLLPELKKCQLLCIDCHIEKSKEDGTYSKKAIGHGEGRSGKGRCTCAPCRFQKSSFYKIRNALGYNPSDEELEYYREKWGIFRE